MLRTLVSMAKPSMIISTTGKKKVIISVMRSRTMCSTSLRVTEKMRWSASRVDMGCLTGFRHRKQTAARAADAARYRAARARGIRPVALAGPGGAFFHAVQSQQPHRQEGAGQRPGHPAGQGAEVGPDFRDRRPPRTRKAGNEDLRASTRDRRGDGPAGGRPGEVPRNHAADQQHHRQVLHNERRTRGSFP